MWQPQMENSGISTQYTSVIGFEGSFEIPIYASGLGL